MTNISRPQKHRWQPTCYTHTTNPPYRKQVSLIDALVECGCGAREFGAAVMRMFGGKESK